MGAPVEKTSSKYLPQVDGLRGLCLLFVYLHHSWVYGLPSGKNLDPHSIFLGLVEYGWVGVTFFFTLSGFLITRILRSSRSDENYYRKFYIRRALRIFPVYYGFLVAMLLLAISILAVRPNWGVFSDMMSEWPWALIYGLNLHFAWVGAWSATLISHAWSLCVEEQFYLIWPLFVRWRGRSGLFKVSVAMCAVAFALRIVLAFDGLPEIISRVLTPAVADGFGFGALAALLSEKPQPGIARRAFIASSVVFFVSFVLAQKLIPENPIYFSDAFPFIAALWFGTLLWWAAVAEPRALGFLAARAPRNLGRSSYVMYLMHQPLFVLFGVPVTSMVIRWFGVSTQAAIVLTAVVFLVPTWLASNVVYYFYERRFLALKDKVPV